MRAIALQAQFGLEHLALVERPTPEPGPGQVRVDVKAASINFRDLMMVRGLYNPRQPLPLIPGSDGAGVVSAVGEGVSRVRVGDRVAGIFAQRWLAGPAPADVQASTLGGPLDGMLAEQVVLDAEGVVPIPDGLDFEQAACLPCAAVTAWHAIVEHARLAPGARVLLQGTGGVSLFALAFARAAGAEVTLISSSDEKLARARELGATHTLNYRQQPDWGRAVAGLTDGQGVDHVVEVGGAGTLGQSLQAVAPGGRISVIGVLSGVKTELELTRVLMRGVQLQGIFVGSRAMFEAMNRAIALHRIRPVIDRVFPLAQTRAALEHMAAGAHFGKIVLRVAD